MKTLVKLSLTDRQEFGFCQVTYKCKNPLNQTIYYCLQDYGEKFGGIKLMRCTKDFEPEYEVKTPIEKFSFQFELPKITEYDSNYTEKLKTLCIQWIQKYQENEA